MAQADGELTVAQRLGRLLDQGALPAGGPAEAAERLLERLERPARVALLGLPGCGKSSILNLLTGTVVVPEMLRLPTIIVQHGEDERMLCTLADGRTEVVPGRDLSQVLTLNPALITIEADLPALKVISLLEVAAGPMEADQRRAAVWASKRADILIWCTTSYLPKEQQVWEGMPDMVKDNGFLFLTKIDLLGSREAAQGMLERVELRAGEEFRQVLAISAKQARAAVTAPGGLDRDLFRDSGAAAVITTIKTRVQTARRADTDMAELLIARHAAADGLVTRRPAEAGPDIQHTGETRGWTPPPDPVPEEPAPEAAARAGQRPGPDSATIPEPLPGPLAEPEPEPLPEPEPEKEPTPVPEPAPEPHPRTWREPLADPVVARDAAAGRQPSGDSAAGRRRFADRIRQLPMGDDPGSSSSVPFRATWKSKAEAAAPPPRPAPEAGPEAASPAVPVPEPAAERPQEPAVMQRPGPRNGQAGDTGTDEGGPDDAAIAAMLSAISAAPEAPRVPRDRLDGGLRSMPAETSAPIERLARPSLFGARKPVPASPQPAGRPAGGAAGPGEPVTRLRGPSPRPAGEQPRAPIPAPEEFATSRPAMPRTTPPVPLDAQGQPDPAPAERRARPRITRVVSVRPAPPPAVVSGADQDIVEAAISLIMTRAADLAGWVDPDAKVPVDQILEHSRETAERVAEIIGRGESEDLRRIKADLGEVQDLIMLMQLEKGHAPADDAITLLLQLRRDLETLRSI